jgi:NAD(P)-dependent dehydrogenase (short-subunit alcohol dehydrogenase family)
VTSKSDLAAAAEHVSQKSGYVNLVVANSGITGPTLGGLKQDPSLLEFRDYLQNWDTDEYTNTYAVNTTAVFSTLVAFLELLDKGNKAGNVEQQSQCVAISSAGAFNRVPMAGFAYGGSKAAVVHTMKQFATKLTPYGIRCNVIAPGCKSNPSSHCRPGHRDLPCSESHRVQIYVYFPLTRLQYTRAI